MHHDKRYFAVNHSVDSAGTTNVVGNMIFAAICYVRIANRSLLMVDSGPTTTQHGRYAIDRKEAGLDGTAGTTSGLFPT